MISLGTGLALSGKWDFADVIRLETLRSEVIGQRAATMGGGKVKGEESRRDSLRMRLERHTLVTLGGL